MAGDTSGWTPAFPGQRPPFERGHTASVVHGAFSKRVTGPLAEQIAADLLASEDTPAHLHEPLFAASVMAWAQAEAVCQQLRAFVGGQDLEDSMAELATEEQDEVRDRSGTRRTSTARRVASALDQLRKWESLAASQRARLGLDPASAAKVGRDVAARRYLDGHSTPLDTALEKIDARRRQALNPGQQTG